MFLNETAKDTPVVSQMDATQQKNNHFEQFTYAGNTEITNKLTSNLNYFYVILYYFTEKVT